MNADLSEHRFCPRCDAVTVWDSPGDGTLRCTGPDDDPKDCGPMPLTLTDEEWRAIEAYHRRVDKRAPRHREEPALTVRRTPYVWT